MRCVIAIDQSTQGTKAVLFDDKGKLIGRADKKHKQIVNEKGWISHDLKEIYENTILAVREVLDCSDIGKESVAAVGISNQRESTAIWSRSGEPLADSVVWQCNRAARIADRFKNCSNDIYEKTGLPLSPYFPAAKMTWLLENVSPKESYCLGTMDSYLVYRLTKGCGFFTDYSNASRTQLFNLHTLKWDEELCQLFRIPVKALPEVCSSDACFGYTDFEGYLDVPVPVYGVMGDSHAALFGQGCHMPGQAKATYGTGSSIMMNVGNSFVKSSTGLATSLAWGMGDRVEYVLEGNINYAGAVISWLKNEMGLICSEEEAEELVYHANQKDTAVLIPAFSGLSAPYWMDNARAMILGMSRTTGKAELVKAAVESIAFQVADILTAMEKDSNKMLSELCADGGPAKNRYLMQFQSDISDIRMRVSKQEELSAIGAAYMAGIAAGVYDRSKIFTNIDYEIYNSHMDKGSRNERKNRWKEGINLVCLNAGGERP
ncbi:glycerol kinase [Lacrimispora xylanisolvens]|uniref:ATP:glycerol 3-phosphotransferase n=1 Tax=Lacrimispora xylanisolvens TaxID=384636 RepID=A0A2S6HFS8_9FIRM|nr:glycerol kinase GlpK [Hungatella xylanolytica]PPK76349.1 glycerol kinase [Hungatella xylanolytica]